MDEKEQMSDHELLKMVRFDKSAYRMFVDRYSAKVLARIHRIAGDKLNWHEKQDISQEVFTRFSILAGDPDTIDAIGSISAYLYAAIRNETIQELKTRVSTAEILLFNVDIRFGSDLDDSVISEGLRQEFEENGIPLSQNVSVSVKKSGSRWLIADIDGDRTYLAKRGGTQLKVCETWSTPRYCGEEALVTASTKPVAADKVIAEEIMDAVIKAIFSLKPNLYKVYRLHIQGEKTEDIAAKFGKTRNHIRVLLTRARQAIKDSVSKDVEISPGDISDDLHKMILERFKSDMTLWRLLDKEDNTEIREKLRD